jgi:hypothetical protein
MSCTAGIQRLYESQTHGVAGHSSLIYERYAHLLIFHVSLRHQSCFKQSYSRGRWTWGRGMGEKKMTGIYGGGWEICDWCVCHS